MLRILDRYFLRELTFGVVVTAAVLLLIVVGGTFARVLQQVAGGSFPASVMFQVLGLRVINTLSGLLPLALFVGVLVGLGRMYRDSEMHVLAASGMGRRGLMRPAAMLAIPMAVLIGLLSLWLGPWAERTGDALVIAANRSVVAAGLEAGQFTELPGGGGVMLVNSISRDGSKLHKVFIAMQSAPNNGKPAEVRVITADHGALYQESDGSGRYLGLMDGWQYEIPLGHDNWRRVRYQRNDKSLSDVKPGDVSADDSIDSATSATLWAAGDAPSRAELAWRIAAPITALVLVMLALPLARQSPRESRYGRLLIAVLCYFLYFSLLSLARAMIGQGKLPGSITIWVLHLLIAGGAAWVFWRQYAPRKPRASGA